MKTNLFSKTKKEGITGGDGEGSVNQAQVTKKLPQPPSAKGTQGRLPIQYLKNQKRRPWKDKNSSFMAEQSADKKKVPSKPERN